jgi:hypothetical protein
MCLRLDTATAAQSALQKKPANIQTYDFMSCNALYGTHTNDVANYALFGTKNTL